MYDALQEMGPVDYLCIEFPRGSLRGTALPLLLDLVDTALKGMDYFRSFGIGYPIAVAAQAAIQLSAVFVRRRAWHVVVGVCAWSGFLLSYFTGTLSL